MVKKRFSKKVMLFMAGCCVFSGLTIVMQLKQQKDLPDHLSASGLILTTETQAKIDTIDTVSQENQKMAPSEPLIPVYLVGAVQNPGIYQVQIGSYLYELIEAAGGLSDEAAAEEIDLALKIEKNGRIDIPTRQEYKQDPAGAREVVTENKTDQRVSINQATLEELDTLPGIGPATAKAILDYRTRNGLFKTLNDLLKVPGIKQSRLDAIMDLIKLQ